MRAVSEYLLFCVLLLAAGSALARQKPEVPAHSQRVLKVCHAENPPPCADKPPKIIRAPGARCSKDSVKARIHGTVALRAVVGTDGLIHDPSVVEAVGYGLEDEAIRAVAKWKLKPGESGGNPVPVEIRIEVKFNCPLL